MVIVYQKLVLNTGLIISDLQTNANANAHQDRSSVGQVSVKCRSSVGEVSEKCRSSVSQFSCLEIVP